MQPKAIIIAGLPTTGKTTLGRALAEQTGLHFIDIDQGPASCAPPQEADPYRSAEARARKVAIMQVSYTVLYTAIEANLTAGFSIIASACFSRQSGQDTLKAAVERGGGILKFVWCQYDDTSEEIERRITTRLESGAIGGCRSVGHYLDDRARYEPITLPHIVARMESGEDSLKQTVQEVLRYINT